MRASDDVLHRAASMAAPGAVMSRFKN